MDPNAQRSRGRSGEADAYWQRRFFTLVAGLGVLGLLAWACSGVVSGKRAPQNTAAGSSGTMPAAAYGTASAGQATAGAAGAGRASPASSAPGVALSASPPGSPARPSPRPSVSGTSRPAAASGAGGSPGKPASGNAACPATDVVLTLLASKASYGPHELPAFQIDVVSTDTSACVFDASPQSLRVVVTHGGQLAWNSGACLHDATARVTRLRRGVPEVVPVVWNRRLTVSGCLITVMAASPRTYVAMAQSGAVKSPSQPFRLK